MVISVKQVGWTPETVFIGQFVQTGAGVVREHFLEEDFRNGSVARAVVLTGIPGQSGRRARLSAGWVWGVVWKEWGSMGWEAGRP